MLNYREIDYKNFGKCLEISNGVADILVTLDIGPRILRYGLCGKENMFCEDVDREQTYAEDDMQYLYGQDKVWYIYGGHRLWVAPEYPETYYPDNEPVRYEKIENGAIFYNEVQAITGLRLTIKVEFLGQTELKLTHYVINESGESQDYALWTLTALGKDGVEILKQNVRDTGMQPNRLLRFWTYSNIADPRVNFGSKFITLRQDRNNTDSFKLGLDLEDGMALYVKNGVMFRKQYTHYVDTLYPDDGCSFETFTNHRFLECETLGEFGPKPDGSISTHVETWKLYDGVTLADPKDEAELEKLWNLAQD